MYGTMYGHAGTLSMEDILDRSKQMHNLTAKLIVVFRQDKRNDKWYFETISFAIIRTIVTEGHWVSARGRPWKINSLWKPSYFIEL